MRAFAARSFGANASVTVPAGMRGSAPALAGGDASASARSTKRALTARFPRWEASAVGLAGSILVSLGAFGAGATLRHDPVLSGTVFSIVRFGHGRLLATAVVYLGIFLLVSAWVRLGHSARAGQANARKIVRTTWMWCVPLLGAPPLFSTDLYTYLAQGVVAHAGFDPYTRVAADFPGPITDNAAGGWLRVPSPYGPLHILIVKSVLSVTGDNVILGALLTRLAMTAGLALMCVAVPILCRQLGSRPECALWMAVANPLTVLCVVSGGHNDLLMIGLLSAGAALVITTVPGLGFVLVALAAAVKAPAAVALPFLLWEWARRRSGGRTSVRGYGFTLVATVSIVVSTMGLCSVAAGVSLGWIGALSGNSVLEPWLSASTSAGKIVGLLTGDPAAAVAVSRIAGCVVLVAVVAWLWWRSRAGGADAVRGAAAALFVTVVLAPVALPWYFTWPLVLGSAAAWPVSRVAVAAAASTWLVVSTHPDGKSLLPPWGFAVLAVASVVVGVLTMRGKFALLGDVGAGRVVASTFEGSSLPINGFLAIRAKLRAGLSVALKSRGCVAVAAPRSAQVERYSCREEQRGCLAEPGVARPSCGRGCGRTRTTGTATPD
ncbi:polyprenol phosphomannose-dependent alpha 1,6 mannosyltransferase MptB [Amycolatopsis sp. FU40]|uniref:polyprenol phosphomannose-dependent alpha 1,6 mannosyltransferase MptB n=1 Tax=Amycolatopsis sp. FU40 TaxID=2914159 RepID=UPI001F346FE2|nr:polyprenol phosphomannose-dependent alpha 1,6 mannosyltransferase MptB [Amycolatopsis sp. FU40]UKD54817.1 polyprenol phosphomannose-dependent alpha 1,6 mannosyltransferase MptB [Amycolatopsis sp. FU40]